MSKNEHEKTRSGAAVVSQLCRELARAVLQNKIAKMTSNIDNHHKQQINVKKMHDVLTCAPYTQERRKKNLPPHPKLMNHQRDSEHAERRQMLKATVQSTTNV